MMRDASSVAAVIACLLLLTLAMPFAQVADAQTNRGCTSNSIACADGEGAKVEGNDGEDSGSGSKPRPRPGRPGSGGGGNTGGTGTSGGGGGGDVPMVPDYTDPRWEEEGPNSCTMGNEEQQDPTCFMPDPNQPQAQPVPGAPAPPPPDPETAARHAIAKIEFPTAPPQVGPPPSINEWNAAVVGYPLWLWNDAGPLSASDSDQGLTVTLQATPVSTRFDMGDGNKVRCTDTTPWTRRVKTSAPSPTCGYTYQLPSLNKAGRVVPHTLQQVTTWKIDWTAGNQSGTLNAYVPSDTTTMRVVELQAIITG